MSDFEEYKKQGEPDKQKKAENWGVAIGLQQVDGLLPSKYLIEVAKDNIEGKISIDEAAEQVKQYYKINPAITLKEQGEKDGMDWEQITIMTTTAGAEAVRKAIDDAEDFFAFLLAKESENQDLAQPAVKTKIAQKLLKFIMLHDYT